MEAFDANVHMLSTDKAAKHAVPFFLKSVEISEGRYPCEVLKYVLCSLFMRLSIIIHKANLISLTSIQLFTFVYIFFCVCQQIHFLKCRHNWILSTVCKHELPYCYFIIVKLITFEGHIIHDDLNEDIYQRFCPKIEAFSLIFCTAISYWKKMEF